MAEFLTGRYTQVPVTQVPVTPVTVQESAGPGVIVNGRLQTEATYLQGVRNESGNVTIVPSADARLEAGMAPPVMLTPTQAARAEAQGIRPGDPYPQSRSYSNTPAPAAPAAAAPAPAAPAATAPAAPGSPSAPGSTPAPATDGADAANGTDEEGDTFDELDTEGPPAGEPGGAPAEETSSNPDNVPSEPQEAPPTTTALNDVESQSDVYAPRARVFVDGEIIYGVLSFHVTSNNFLGADHWTLHLNTGLDGEKNNAWWADKSDAEIEIQVSLSPELSKSDKPDDVAWKTLLVGVIDESGGSFSERSIHLSGRDLTARLIDTQLIDSYPNQKASDLARMFAAEHKLKADVVDSPGLAGSHYDNNHHTMTSSTFSRAVSQWDLLALHAQKEGYELGVDSKTRTLFYRPRKPQDKEHVWLIKYQGGKEVKLSPQAAVLGMSTINAETLEWSHRNFLAKDIRVIIISHNSATGQTVRKIARGGRVRSRDTGSTRVLPTVDSHGIPYIAESGMAPGSPRSAAVDSHGIPYLDPPVSSARQPRTTAPDTVNSKVLSYTFNIPGLTEQQAVVMAQSKLHELTVHEREIDFTMPGETKMTPYIMVKLEGTDSSLDQLYYISSISREYGNGYVQKVNCRNSSPRDMPGEDEGDGEEDGANPNSAANASGAPHAPGAPGAPVGPVQQPLGSAAQQQAHAARVAGRPDGATQIAAGSLSRSSSTAEVEAAVRQQAIYEGVDPDFAVRIAHSENGLRIVGRDGNIALGPLTKSGEHAIGAMQLMPATARGLGVDPFDPTSNIIGGVRYLGQQQDKYGTNQTVIAASYNWGPRGTDTWLKSGAPISGLPPETQKYVRQVARN